MITVRFLALAVLLSACAWALWVLWRPENAPRRRRRRPVLGELLVTPETALPAEEPVELAEDLPDGGVLEEGAVLVEEHVSVEEPSDAVVPNEVTPDTATAHTGIEDLFALPDTGHPAGLVADLFAEQVDGDAATTVPSVAADLDGARHPGADQDDTLRDDTSHDNAHAADVLADLGVLLRFADTDAADAPVEPSEPGSAPDGSPLGESLVDDLFAEPAAPTVSVVVDSTSRAARRRAARAERIERKAAASNARRAAKAAAKAAKDAKKAAKDDAKRAAKQAVKKTAKTPVTPSTGAASTSLAQDGALGVSVPPAGDGWPVAPATTVTAPTPFEVPASKQPKQSKAKRTKSKPAKTKTVKTKPAKAKTGKAKPARTAPRPMPAATPAPGGSPAVRDGADLWASALPPAPAHDALPEQLPQDDPWAAAASATTSRTTPPASHLGAASNPPGAASPAPIDRQPATGALADDAAWVSSVGSVPARPAEAPAPRGSRQAPGKRPEADVDPGVFGIPEGLPDRQDRVIEDAPRDAS